MLVPPVVQGGTGSRQVGDTGGNRGQQSTVPSAPATLWPLAPSQHNQTASQQSHATPPLAATPLPAHNQGVSRYGLYSLFPGGGGASYVAATPATPSSTSARAYHATTHKERTVSESVFSAAVGVGVGGYTWGAPTPPPGSPYSPVPVTQLELLAKNLASLAPHHATGHQQTSHQAHQSLSLQGAVGVNVAAAAAGASLHHAQHTQHTLNLAGLHHLHHGGLHQNAFSPQLSLVTAGTPTLTINSFSSPSNSQQGSVVPTTGVLLHQDYQTQTQAITSTGCTTAVNVSTIPSGSTSSSMSTMLVQAGAHNGNNTGGFLQQTTSCSSSSSMKKLENFGTVQTTTTGQTVKLENKTRQPCICKSNNGKTKLVHSDAGCSRTLPVASSWNSQTEGMTLCTSNSNNIVTGTTTTGVVNASLVKREPMTTVPCQVAEVSTSLHATTTAVKIEPMPTKSENGIVVSTAGSGGIPVGIAVARQRLQHQETTSSSMRNVSLSHHTSHHASYHHFQPDNLGSATAMTMGGATLVHCGNSGDERPAHLTIPSGSLAPSLNAALGSTLNSGLGNIGGAGNPPAAGTTAASWPPTIWQYPTAAMPAMEPVGFPQMGVGLQSGLQGGLQLVRDPTSGHLLLIHAAAGFSHSAEQMQQAVVWPNYPNHNGHNIGPPPLLLPPPPQPPSLQLLSDIGGARFVLTENKRKQQSTVPIVKIEADCGSSPTTIIASAESSKTLQTVTSMASALMPDAPLLTTLHYYPHAPALVQISQAEQTHCTSQQRHTFLSKATSPVSCLTPPPEVSQIHAIEPPETTPIGVQDASNQTDGVETDDEHLPNDSYVKQEHCSTPCQSVMTNPTSFDLVSSSHERTKAPLGMIPLTNNTLIDQSMIAQTACNLIGKFEKSENTVINAADCTRYATTTSVTTITRCGSEINSVDRTIESVVSCRSINDDDANLDEEDSLNIDEESGCEDRVSRIGSRVIEITEENCDSFHENLEFFGRRRDPVEQIRKPFYSEAMLNEERALEIKRNEDSISMLETSDEITSKQEDEQISVGSPQIANHAENAEENLHKEVATSKELVVPSVCEESARDCDDRGESVVESTNPPIVEEPSQVFGRSFDMPSIDCDEERETLAVIVVKQEKDDETIGHDSHSGTNDASSQAEKSLRHERKQSVERFHPGIENVVEKLKKNAAAALHDHQAAYNSENSREGQSEIERSPSHLEQPSRKLENGLKKMLLRSHENSANSEHFSSSMSLETHPKIIQADSFGKGVCSKTWLPTDNNNDISSNNHNLKITDKNTNDAILKGGKIAPIYPSSNSVNQDEEYPREFSSNKLSTKIEADQTIGRKYDLTSKPSFVNEIIDSKHSSQRDETKNCIDDQIVKLKAPEKPKQNVDLSGLELLSNSIAQYEHLVPGTPGYEDHVMNSSDQQSQQDESNNNEVDSPLGLLCALAEQRFMEEVGSSGSKKPKEYVDNSEEISQAGRLLLNLGKCSDNERKRKRSLVDENEEDGIDKSKRIREDSTGRESPSAEYTPRFVDKYSKARRFVAKSREDTLYADKTRRNSVSMVNNEVAPTTNGTKRNYVENEVEFTDSEAENIDARVCPLRLSISREDSEKCDLTTAENPNGNDQDWPNMDAMELDMRVRMADIQKQYKEKQKELLKLPPKKDEKRSPGRPRKKSQTSSDYGSMDLNASPPKSPIDEALDNANQQPLTSMPNLAIPRCNVNLVKLGEPRSHIKLLDNIPSIPIPVPPVASPITVLPAAKLITEDEDKNSLALGYETASSSAPTVASSSSASKKRKVGRPRKLMCSSGSARHLTETIVAKKPKSKSSLVGYLMTSKNRHLQNKFLGKSGYTPLPFKSGIAGNKNSKSHKIAKSKVKPVKQTPLHNKNVISSIIAEKAKLSQETKLERQVTKVKPKLKAEAKMKMWEEDESGEWNYTIERVPPEVPSVEKESTTEMQPEPAKIVVEEETNEVEPDRQEKLKKKKRKSTSTSPNRRKSSDHERKESRKRKSSLDCKECKECAKAAKADNKSDNILSKCKLTDAHLAIDQLRVLTAMGGLFYAGRLSAVQAPDVYAITLDGERGNRPHIHSREEILRDAIVEVCPSSTKELPPGTRLCAYWSQQYRCLYPGTSVEPSEADPELDEKFVSVEFDDGDSGRIALDDIRLLQPDYPVVEYDPNPLLTLGKRRRQTSMSTDEKRSSSAGNVRDAQSLTIARDGQTNENLMVDRKIEGDVTELRKGDGAEANALGEHRERKRLKKRRRDKLKRLNEAQEGKKKHRKHKCCEEHRKHKHRKHRKHKHKHNHHSSYSEGSHVSGGESCSGHKSEEETSPSNENAEKALDIPQEEEEVGERNEGLCQPQEEEEERLDEPVVDPIIPEGKVEKPKKQEKKAKARERQESVESRSKMAAFLPARQLWGWAGKGYRRPGAKGRAKKQFFRAIQRGNETIQIGDSAVFLSTGRPDRPYIGRIESMWETSSSNMIVKVKWFYHPEETVGCPPNLKYPGALFESPHMDENDVQTISHKCEVLKLADYTKKLGKEPHRYLTIYDNNDIYYLAGYYDPTTYLLNMQPDVV
ncbi:uncharacterized protein wge isoform X4 [Venturia canescens]|uniref:uncharacterized protein wge isoform X4 n=1 Tax=Venturia canescens TaxID=32260 RepID=UPI001C9BC0C1|nr:uncharacterized protein LOC122419484 isoform X4 [Venturia canescens]